jgi:hypothetical protein
MKSHLVTGGTVDEAKPGNAGCEASSMTSPLCIERGDDHQWDSPQRLLKKN